MLTLLFLEFLTVHNDVVFAMFVTTDSTVLTTYSLTYYAFHLEERKNERKSGGYINPYKCSTYGLQIWANNRVGLATE